MNGKAISALLLAAGLALCTGCRDNERDTPSLTPNTPISCEVNVAPVEEVLGTAVPLAYAATLAMAAMAGNDMPCVSVTTECATPPCSGSVTVALNDSCVLPLGSVGNGVILVTGQWTSPEEANLTAVYQGVSIDSENLFVRQGAFAATASGDTITVVYADQNVEMTTTSDAAIEQSAWTVSVNTGGTLADTDDDVMIIDGTRQYAGTSGLSQLVLTGVKMRASCPANPVDGDAMVYEVGSTSPATVLSFHGSCDGEADVTVTTCLRYIGGSVPLDLLN